MARFRLWLTSKAAPEPTGKQGISAPALQMDTVRPRRHFGLGRRLAFAIDENSLQMAAARHYGNHIVFDEVEKVFLKTDSDSKASSVSALSHEIKTFVTRHGGRNPHISLCLAGPGTALRLATIPWLKPSEVASAIQFEAKRQVPFPIADCLVDYRVTHRITHGKDRRLKAAILVATKPTVENQIALFEELGLEVSEVYHAHDVIGHLLEMLPGFDSRKNYTLINVHKQRTEISYYLGSNLEFFHTSSLGSSFLANRSDPTVFEYFSESLATEIQNSFDFYTGQFSAHSIDQVLIYGNLAHTEELTGMLSNRFGFSFSSFPAKELDFISARDLPFADNLTACLPAVAAAANRLKLASLLPPKARLRRKRRLIDRFGIAATVATVCLLGGHYIGARSSINSSQKALEDLNAQVEQFRGSASYATYNHMKSEIARNQDYMNLAQEQPSFLGLNLKELSRLTPSEVQLYDLEFRPADDSRSLLVSGLITTDKTPPEVILAELVENLTASPFYEEVTIERHLKKRQKNEHVLDFSLGMRGII